MNTNKSIVFSRLTVGVNSIFNKNVKIILNSISGGFEFNSLNAVMGSSGSGKTTLLKCLNDSNEYVLSEESVICVNRSESQVIKCFIHQNQEQRVMKGLTVRQCLLYASKLKNSCLADCVDHRVNVNDLMSELLISDISDNPIEKCSGGEVKRICIALELTSVRKPSLLFIDEPTTGLDSYAAQVVSICIIELFII